MPMQFSIDAERNILLGEASGDLTEYEFIIAAAKDLDATRGGALYRPMLLLFSEDLSLHNIDYSSLVRIKDQIVRWVEIYPGRRVRTALVTRDSTHVPLAKMWQALTEAYPDVGTTVKVFDEEASAIKWLTVA